MRTWRIHKSLTSQSVYKTMNSLSIHTWMNLLCHIYGRAVIWWYLCRELCLYSTTITPSKLINVKLASTCSLKNSMHFPVTIVEQKQRHARFNILHICEMAWRQTYEQNTASQSIPIRQEVAWNADVAQINVPKKKELMWQWQFIVSWGWRFFCSNGTAL